MAYTPKFPLKEELIDDSHSTVKDAIGADFRSNEDAEKKREKEEKAMGKVIPPIKTEPKKESVTKYKSPFVEGGHYMEDDDIESPEALVDSWINGNKSHVIEKIKGMSPGMQEDVIHALVAHLVMEQDESALKGLILGLMK